MSSKPKALFITANYWNNPSRVGSHELAEQFVNNGWQVGFVSDPVSPIHLLKLNNKIIRDRFRLFLSGGKKYLNENLWAYISFTLFPPYNFPFLKSKFVLNNWQNFTFPNVHRKIKSAEFDNVELLYFDNAVQSFWINKIKYRKVVFRIADNYAGYSKYANYIRRMEEKLATNADLVLYTARNLNNYIRGVDPAKLIYFPNGVNFKIFAEGERTEPDDIKKIPRPRIIYIGEMEVRFDFDTVKYAANKLPGYSFILIGNDIKAKKEFRKYSNVYLMGIKESKDLPAYLYNTNAGIIPFDTNKMGELISYVNPLKIHQYFACGLPVVSARWQELENMNTKALLYNNKNEFVSCLKKAITEPIDRQQLIEEAEKNDWKYRYQQLMQHLGFDA